MKSFNTAAICIPSKHYMVDLTERVAEIKKLVDGGKYFVINRARQYGKTTTLNALRTGLQDEYFVLSVSFQRLTDKSFISENDFVLSFCKLMKRNPDVYRSIPAEIRDEVEEYLHEKNDRAGLEDLFQTFSRWCAVSERPVVLMIDEVDQASDSQVFLNFLGLLRDDYISRDAEGMPAFQSVILAGVTDIKHLKSRVREGDRITVNSPWNIAVEFDVDMSLSEGGIKGMLEEYEEDHHTGMDTAVIANAVREYTYGYPFFVSRICQLIDTKLVPGTFNTLAEAWSIYGVDEAVKRILFEDNSLFDSVIGKLINMPELKNQLRRTLFLGESIDAFLDNEEQKYLRMYGLVRYQDNKVVIMNRIFEMRLYNYFLSESKLNEDIRQSGHDERHSFVLKDGALDVPMIMDHFITEHNRIHGDSSGRFLEEEGRERFLTYLAAVINGTGTYSIEEQTRDRKRMDVVIHYLGRRYVIELKIWRGERYNARGEQQILDYLDYFGLDTGYMLSFNFNKEKESGVERVQVGDKVLYEGIV